MKFPKKRALIGGILGFAAGMEAIAVAATEIFPDSYNSVLVTDVTPVTPKNIGPVQAQILASEQPRELVVGLYPHGSDILARNFIATEQQLKASGIKAGQVCDIHAVGQRIPYIETMRVSGKAVCHTASASEIQAANASRPSNGMLFTYAGKPSLPEAKK